MDEFEARIPYERCPLCDSNDSFEEMIGDCSGHVLYKPGIPRKMRWLRCRQCRHMYIDGYYSPAALNLIFANAQETQTPGQHVEDSRPVFARIVEVVCEWLPRPRGRWLDIGFGNGSLVTTAAEFGFHAVGLDLRESNVRLMQKFGFEAHAVEFEKYRPEEPFDVISMADVLEHMPYPKPALQHAHSLLREGGVLFLSMPNADSFAWKFLTWNNANPYWGEIEHYHNFGRERLYSLLEECSFEPVRYGVSMRYRACMEVVARKGGGSRGDKSRMRGLHD